MKSLAACSRKHFWAIQLKPHKTGRHTPLLLRAQLLPVNKQIEASESLRVSRNSSIFSPWTGSQAVRLRSVGAQWSKGNLVSQPFVLPWSGKDPCLCLSVPPLVTISFSPLHVGVVQLWDLPLQLVPIISVSFESNEIHSSSAFFHLSRDSKDDLAHVLLIAGVRFRFWNRKVQKPLYCSPSKVQRSAEKEGKHVPLERLKRMPNCWPKLLLSDVRELRLEDVCVQPGSTWLKSPLYIDKASGLSAAGCHGSISFRAEKSHCQHRDHDVVRTQCSRGVLGIVRMLLANPHPLPPFPSATQKGGNGSTIPWFYVYCTRAKVSSQNLEKTWRNERHYPPPPPPPQGCRQARTWSCSETMVSSAVREYACISSSSITEFCMEISAEVCERCDFRGRHKIGLQR